MGGVDLSNTTYIINFTGPIIFAVLESFKQVNYNQIELSLIFIKHITLYNNNKY